MKSVISIMCTLAISSYACAVPMSTDHMSGMPTQGYKAEYQHSMQTMDQAMMPAMQADNPDIAFAQGMLAHHKGAVKMAEIQLKYGHDRQMRQLAIKIIREQNTQIKILQKWLQQHSHP